MIKISVIVFVKNGKKYIRNNLESLKASLRNIEHEIIVSDNGSTDGTVEIITSEFPEVKLLNSSLERSRQVNEGVNIASGKFIYITGVDILYNPEYFSDCMRLYVQHECKAVYTSVVTKDSGWIAEIKKYERELYIGDDFHESARFVDKELFIQIGGYDEEIVAGEDYDFQRRLNEAGVKTLRSDFIAEYHLGEEQSLSHIYKRAFYYGKTLNKFFEKNGPRGVVQMSPIRLNFFSFKAVRKPHLLLGLLFYKGVQSVAAVHGILYAGLYK